MCGLLSSKRAEISHHSRKSINTTSTAKLIVKNSDRLLSRLLKINSLYSQCACFATFTTKFLL